MNIVRPLCHSILAVGIGFSPIGGLEQAIAQDQAEQATEQAKGQTPESEDTNQAGEQIKHDHSEDFYTKMYSSNNIAELEKELKKHPTCQGYVRLCDLFILNKKLKPAERAAKKAIEIDPHNWEGYFDLSTVLLEVGDYDRSWKQLEKCQKLAPNRPEIYVNLGEIQRRRGNFSSAIAYFKMALKIEPHHSDVEFRIQGIEEHLQNYK